jgi:hypothetical protein
MDDWEHYFAEGTKRRGRSARRRSLGLAIVVASALATLILILWLVKAEVPGLPFNHGIKSHPDLRTPTDSAARQTG